MGDEKTNGVSYIERIDAALARIAATEAEIQRIDRERHNRFRENESKLGTLIDAQKELIGCQQQLRTAPVVLTDPLDGLAVRFDQLAVSFDKLAISGRNADDRMRALIGVVAALDHAPPREAHPE